MTENRRWIVQAPACPTSRYDKFYGPFDTVVEAQEWADQFNFHVPWVITELLFPWKMPAL